MIEFTQGNQLRFVDPRTFGEVFVVDPARLAEDAPDLAELGWDPLEDPLPWGDFARLVLSRRQQLKALLTDQKTIAGLGNIYSDEVLHLAGLRYDRPVEHAHGAGSAAPVPAMIEVVHDAIGAGGSSLADEQYVDLFGKTGTYQLQHQVYAREGKACLRCRATIERTKWGGRSTFYCPACQV